MFPFHAAFSLGMIALTGGTALYAWSSSRTGNEGMGFAKLIGILVIIFSITSTLCTVYYGVKYWWEGDFQTPMFMSGMQMQNKPMMNESMMRNERMKNKTQTQ